MFEDMLQKDSNFLIPTSSIYPDGISSAYSRPKLCAIFALFVLKNYCQTSIFVPYQSKLGHFSLFFVLFSLILHSYPPWIEQVMTRKLLTFCTGMSSKKLVCDVNRYHLMSILRRFFVGIFFILINLKQNICNLQLISVFLIV